MLKFLFAVYNNEGNFLKYRTVHATAIKELREAANAPKLSFVTAFHRGVVPFEDTEGYSLIFPLLPLLDKNVLLLPRSVLIDGADIQHVDENFFIYAAEMSACDWSKVEKLVPVNIEELCYLYFVIAPKNLGKIEMSDNGLATEGRAKICNQLDDLQDRYIANRYFHPFKKDVEKQQRSSNTGGTSEDLYNIIFKHLSRYGKL